MCSFLESFAKHRRDDGLADVCVGTVDLPYLEVPPKHHDTGADADDLGTALEMGARDRG